ncbi:haloacid dehalogenase type II [Bradyrhizobium sp. PRIMUS42]|uniref:haloacid dehalogenase type II n=1 Tax=Bradyrhizobium sp. PRIMUS42 TaxID=2908926 RepID=UPI001FF60653|nr:haloacid dehalogenase type II [Bradyrhizobium sp. PRIMUS42]MCJ9728606.1 haloacid dehalogenase type II [Bradyrhizobium sp. PRIMUS42]
MKGSIQDVKVVVFDTFGTVVDWRGSIIRDLSAWGREEGIHADWTALADRWRHEYEPEKNRVRNGEIGWTNLDELHAHALEKVAAEVGIKTLTQSQMQHVNSVWHRLDGWPDAAEGLTRLKRKYVIGPLSNGNVALLVNMAKHAGLPWDNVFSCELFRHFKPHPETYLGVCRLMYLKPAEVMMCAAHNYDLAAARALGLKTAFIPRPTEYGHGQKTDLVPAEDWEIVAKDIIDLAQQLGA